MIVLRNKTYSSKAQKKRKERWEVLKGQDIMDRENESWGKNADKALKTYEKAGLPADDPRVKMATKEKADTVVSNQLSKELRANPNVGKETSGRAGFVNDMKVFDKKLARSGASSFEEYETRGGNSERLKQTTSRPRGVKKVRGAKEPAGTITPEVKQAKILGLNPKHQEKFYENRRKRAAVRWSIAKHEAKAAELKAKKAAGEKLIKNLKTAGKAGLGIAATAGVGYGINKAINKKKDDSSKK